MRRHPHIKMGTAKTDYSKFGNEEVLFLREHWYCKHCAAWYAKTVWFCLRCRRDPQGEW